MPRPRRLIRPASFHCNIPEDLKVKIDLALFSPLENRIPYGAYSEFLAEAIRDRFERKCIDLAEHSPHFPVGSVIQGSQKTLSLLLAFLTQKNPS